MSPLVLNILDSVFMIVHLTVILINILGWMHPKTRRLQRWVLSLTVFSWLILGAWFNWGYCFLTDWHWDLKRELGEQQLPASFIQYILSNKWGLALPNVWVDAAAASVFVLLIVICLMQLYLEHRSQSRLG